MNRGEGTLSPSLAFRQVLYILDGINGISAIWFDQVSRGLMETDVSVVVLAFDGQLRACLTGWRDHFRVAMPLGRKSLLKDSPQ